MKAGMSFSPTALNTLLMIFGSMPNLSLSAPLLSDMTLLSQ